MWNRLNEWLALTRTERHVIVFLVVTMLTGLGIRFYQERFPGGLQFDYRTSDSTFAALSEAALADSSDDQAEVRDGGIALNSATKEELLKVPGIGGTTADRILAYRSTVGRFSSVNELMKVKGISKKKFQKLKAYFTAP